MNKLVFYDDKHIYKYNGVEIPSVSELLRFISREIYGDIDKYVLDNAAERGTTVHLATQNLDEAGICEVSPNLYGYVEAYANFLREHTVKWEYIEKPLAHPELLYAGTIDRAGILDGRRAVVDFKTTSVVKKTLVKAQLNGYDKLLKANGFQTEDLYCLQLLSNGKYRFYQVRIDDTEFMACYAIHMALKKRQKRGCIE